MIGERKRLKEDVYRLESLLRNLGYTKELLVSLKGDESFEQHQAYLESAIDDCKKKAQELPIGHRYTGKFFVKKPYTIPAEYECHEGSLFMREDLVTWQREIEGEQYQPWQRVVYKDLETMTEIKRSDGQPVFEQ